jgi:hypothetical protein
MAVTKIDIEFAFICDEVRREDSGKLLIIGVYTYDILVINFPVSLVLTVVVSFNIDAPIETDFELKVSHNGKVMGGGKGHFNLQKSTIIGLPKIPLQNISGPGELKFEIRFGDGAWQTLRKTPISSANVSPPPFWQSPPAAQAPSL